MGYTISYIVSKLLKKALNIPAIIESKIHVNAHVCTGCHVVRSTLGRYSYIATYSEVVDTEIGSFCSIGSDCIIGGASHPLDWISTSPVFHEGKNPLRKNFSNHKYSTTKKTHIGNDVWIGSHCLIKSGVHISDGAVIGMGSVVTKDVESYSIVAGNPAKIIRRRFNEETINKLLQTSWWNFSDAKLKDISVLSNDPIRFISMLNDEGIGV